jgi:pyruvate/2-oxoglutarate dehydrogenase complex dihydrolipoamide acyltransferase (E2) component
MSETVDIVVPRENVNDESATLVSWSVADGDRVERGHRVAQIETSKAVMDLEAPAAGILRHAIRAGEEVPVGAAIGQVVSEIVDSAPASASIAPAPPSLGAARASTDPTRISAKAKALIRELGLDEASFNGRGLVRSHDIQAAIDPASTKPGPTPAPARSVGAAGVPTRIEPLSRAKRTEANHLRSGFESTLASIVTVPCPTRGFREAAAGNAAAIILFETARLLRKHPGFNAFHDGGSINYYEEVNIGFAVDPGGKLKVPVIRNADQKGITAIADEMRDMTVACLENTLPVQALAGGTFTLTDLSGEGVTLFHPLINRGQSAILGVCADVLPPGKGWGFFNLVLAYDHQLSEGRTAARFLKALVSRIEYHESSVLRHAEAAPVEMPRCARCKRGYSELTANGNLLLQAVKADGAVQPLCNLCIGWWS